ncbi:hypothetical protein GCM10028809_15300 [Spirosoma gilvum]
MTVVVRWAVGTMPHVLAGTRMVTGHALAERMIGVTTEMINLVSVGSVLKNQPLAMTIVGIVTIIALMTDVGTTGLPGLTAMKNLALIGDVGMILMNVALVLIATHPTGLPEALAMTNALARNGQEIQEIVGSMSVTRIDVAQDQPVLTAIMTALVTNGVFAMGLTNARVSVTIRTETALVLAGIHAENGTTNVQTPTMTASAMTSGHDSTDSQRIPIGLSDLLVSIGTINPDLSEQTALTGITPIGPNLDSTLASHGAKARAPVTATLGTVRTKPPVLRASNAKNQVIDALGNTIKHQTIIGI